MTTPSPEIQIERLVKIVLEPFKQELLALSENSDQVELIVEKMAIALEQAIARDRAQTMNQVQQSLGEIRSALDKKIVPRSIQRDSHTWQIYECQSS